MLGMPWRIVERKIGRAGSEKQRAGRQRDWDQAYGPDNWAVGYVIDGDFVLQEEALESIYYRSYESHFREHPQDVEELTALAKVLRNPHAEATTGVDLQIPAITRFLEENGLQLRGREVVDIGTWNGKHSHPISVRLSPLQIRCVLDSSLTLEAWWQSKKCLAVWED